MNGHRYDAGKALPGNTRCAAFIGGSSTKAANLCFLSLCVGLKVDGVNLGLWEVLWLRMSITRRYLLDPLLLQVGLICMASALTFRR